MVEACFAHVGVLGKRFGEPDLDWRKIEKDLQAVMRKAVVTRLFECTHLGGTQTAFG